MRGFVGIDNRVRIEHAQAAAEQLDLFEVPSMPTDWETATP